MPIYTTSYGKRYNIPSDIAAQFEKDFPDAQIRYEASGEEYDIPLKKRDSFLKAYPNAKTVDRISTPPKQDTQPEYRGYSGYNGAGGLAAQTPLNEPAHSGNRATDIELQQLNNLVVRNAVKTQPTYEDPLIARIHAKAQQNSAQSPFLSSDPQQNSSDSNAPITSFGEAFSQGSNALYQGVKNAVGESAGTFIGSQKDYAKAVDLLSELQASGYSFKDFDPEKADHDYLTAKYNQALDTWHKVKAQRKKERESMGAWDAFKHLLKDPTMPTIPGKESFFQKAQSQADDIQRLRAFKHIAEALHKTNGDVEQAKSLLGHQAQTQQWSDKVTEDARNELASMRPTEGTAAFIGNLVPQMIGNAAAIGASFSPYTRWLARPLAQLNMATLTASSAGSSMADARLYAEQTGKPISESDVKNAGLLSGGIEAVTELIPYARIFNRIQHVAGLKSGRIIVNAVKNNPVAQDELTRLVKQAGSEFPTKLITKKGAKRLAGDILTEGTSEAVAGGLGTLVPILYSNKEDYPTLHNILSDAWEGAKGGLFMGAILGAGSALSGNFANRERRKKLGKITLADTGNGVVEIVGAKSDGTLFAVDGNNKILEIPKSQILDIAEVGFKEFDAYTKKITDETLAAAVQSGKMAVQQNADPSAKQAIKQHLDQVSAPFSEERLQELHAVKNPMQYISEHPQEAPQLLEWFKANSTYTGMIEAVQDQINQKIKESDDAVDSRTHTDGNLYTITLKGDNAAQGYITQGDVAFNPDGSVNKTKSNDRVTVRYADGHSEMLSIDDLGRLVETNNAQELKAQNADAIWEEESRRAAAEIDGTTGPSQGDPITLKDGRRGIFYADTGDGNYLVQLEDGSVIPAPQTAVTLLNRQPSQQEQQPTPQPAQTTPQQTAEQTMTPSPAQEPQNGVDNRIGRSLNQEEADNLIAEMENRAEPAPELELTPENWTAEFGKDGMVDTPIGKVKMGENQYQKLAQKGRNGKLGMIKPTLTNPDVIIEDKSQAKEGQQTERPSSYVFVKSFIDETGERRYYFTSVTISKEGNEVVISNQERKRNRIHTLFKEGKLIHVKKAALPTESATSAQGNQFTVPGGATLQGKNTNTSANFQTNTTDNQPQNGVDNRIGRSLNKEEADDLIAEMENRAEPAPELELTPENWTAEFGKDGMVDTPIGKVKMGENQYQKLVRNKRENYFGMIKPTLESPDMVLEEADPKEGAERDTKLIFVKTFTKPDGSRVVHFENVTIQKDNLEVSISSHELQKSALQKKMQQDNLLHLKGLFSSEGRLAEPQIEGSDLVPTPSLSSTNEDTTPFAENQIPADQNNTDTSSEATQTPTEVTYPRDEKTGHILFDQIDDPTVVAAALRNEFGEQALEAAQTKLQDLQGELEKAASTKDTFERLYKQRDLQREIAKYQQVVSTLTPTEVEQITPQEMNRAEVQPENVQNETNRSEQQGQETTNADTQTTNADQSEVDENGRPFVKASDGSTVFGEITEDTGLTPAPIKLSEGVITNTTTNDGYGLAHIEARHGDQIRQAGFDSVEEFVESVAKNYDQIKEGRKRNDGSETYLLQLEDKHNNTLFVELSKDGSYWNINSAGIFNNKYARGNKVVYSRHTQTNQFAETGEGSPSTEQSGTQSDASTLPPTSANEDTTNIQENQESASKNTENQTNPPTNKTNTPILPKKQTAPKYAKEIAQFGDEVSIEDVVLRDIALGQKFSWEDHGKSRGIASELGFTGKEAERRSRISMLRNDGITVDDYVHGLWQEYGERFRQDDAQIRDAVLDILQSVYSPKAAMEQLRNLHAQEEFSQEEQNILTPEEREAFWNIPVSEYAFREPEANTPEEQQIIDQAKQNGTYMKAPNGQPSNLTEKQWVQVRTQAFKNWFGDWEKAARIEKLRRSKPLVVSGNDYQEKYELNSRSAGKYIVDSLRGEYINADTQSTIRISRKSQKVAHHDAESEAHLKSIAYIPQMIENAVFVDELTNIKDKNGFDSYRYYVVGLKMDGIDYTAKLTVGVKHGEAYYDHSLTEIEKSNLIDQIDLVKAQVYDDKAAKSSIVKDKRLVSLLQTNSSNKIDKNREPLASEVDRFEQENIRFRDHNISAFAKKHNLNEQNVKDYAEYMQTGNIIGASRAFHEIRRQVRLDNTGISLGQFTKLFSPIKKELYSHFGDIDELRDKYVQVEMEVRGVMNAARKKATEEKEADKKRLQEFELMSDQQLNDEYDKAISEKNESRMRDLVNEAARRNGYGDVNSEYQGVGAWKAPGNPGYNSVDARRAALETDGTNINVMDIADGYTSQPDNYFTNLHEYGNDTPYGKESAAAINQAIVEAKKGDKPMITVYRAVPMSIKENQLRNGDWVTPSRKYAELHGNSRLEGDYRIIKQEVPADELWWDGNDINEWGYDDGKKYAYRNTGNNRKLNDLITRDENGNIIPLSQRFNARKNDVRYREQEQINDQFNAELQQQIEGTLPQGHIYQLGHPSEALRAAGIPDLPIELAASQLNYKATSRKHDFSLDEIRDLPQAIASPMATFSYGDPGKAQNILTVLQHNGENFLVGLFIKPTVKGRVLEVNSIRNVFPKNSSSIIRWINDGKLTSVDKEKLLSFLDQQRTNYADVAFVLPEEQVKQGKAEVSEEEISSATNIVNSFENPTLSDGEKVATAEELAQSLHTPIRIVKNVNEINANEKDALRKRRAYGWYDMETGEVVIVLPNCRDAAEVQATILHEVVGHKGLRELVGEEKYNDLLRRVFDSLDEETRRRLLSRYGHPLIAADEYLASLAEENVEPNVLKRILAQVRNWLREVLGMDIKLSDNDLRYLLWRSKNNLQSKQGIFERAETIAKDAELRNRLGIDSQMREQSANTDDATLDDVNRRFNEQLKSLNKENAQSTILNLGNPGAVLLSSGISDKPIKLYGNKLLKKMSKHGFSIADVQDLPLKINAPIAVFQGSVDNSFAILTELKIHGNNILASLSIGKGNDIDFNIVSSVYGKADNSIVSWITKGKTIYVDKEKALNYLRISAPLAEAQDNQELSLVTNIIKNFENPTLPSEENIKFREKEAPGDLPTSQASSSQEKLREELKHLRTLRKGLDSEVMQYRKRGAQNESSSTRQLKDIIARYNRSQRQIREYVNDILDAQAATTLGKREINTLLSALVRATDPQKAEEAVHRILDTVTTARLRAETARTEKLYSTKIQGETPQGVPEAKGVDDNTRVMIEYFRAHKEENINELEEALRTKEATEGLTPAEQMHMDAIYLIRLYQQATEVGHDYMAASAQMEQLEQQIDTLSKEVWHLQRAKATGGEARRKRTIEQKQQTMVQKGHLLEATRWQLQELKQNYLEQLQGFNDILQEVILNGRSAYLDWVHKQQDRQRKILQGAFADAGPKAMASARQYGGWKPQGPLHKSVLAMRDFFTAPLLSLDYLIRKHTQSAPNGEGHLYNQFIRGEGGYMEASNRYFERTREITDALGEAAQRYMGISGKNMGQRWLRAQAQARRSPLTFSLQLNDGSRPQVISATQALYLRALEKQTDGQVKLRAMGISEEVMEQISQTLQQEAPEMVALADWVQEQLLPSLRESYNATHLRLFGTQMREVAHYFPISINKRETYRENDGTEHEQTLPTTTTGSIISRKPNTTAIDWNMDFFEVLDRHIQQMEHWNAYSEVVQNMNRLTSNTLFKKSLEYKNPGEARKFMDAARVAAEQYRIQVLDHESVIVKLSQAAASSKINFRVWTAIKQIASSPAFVAYSADPQFWATLSKHVATLPATLLGRGDYSWAKANLPDFRRRVQGGTAGNDALERESFSVVRKLSKDPRSPSPTGCGPTRTWMRWSAPWGPRRSMSISSAATNGGGSPRAKRSGQPAEMLSSRTTSPSNPP